MAKYNPVSTYRLQFNKDFALKDAEKLIPYLRKLGIKTIYASPVFQAVRGSMHGYDVTNPLKLNPEIGTEDDFQRLIKKIHENNMGWLQDIVPNHMAFSVENPWIYDVLEKGKHSDFYEFFDILQEHSDENLRGKLMLPFFGKPLHGLINDRELRIAFGETGFKLKYFENEYPISLPAYRIILESVSRKTRPEQVDSFLKARNWYEIFDEILNQLYAGFISNRNTTNYINECLAAVNSNSERMQAVTDELFYLPSFWKDTEAKINYRRFFTINSLICVNIQNKKVFDTTHQLIKQELQQNNFNGIRVDHIDGLFNPLEYLQRLRELTGPDAYVLVEKILEENEKLPANWPVEGSTGYDFLGLANNLLTNPEKGPIFYSYYNDWIDKTDDFSEVFYKKNRFILYHRLRGELDNLTRECMSLKSVAQQTLSEESIKGAIGEFLVFCPVYKLYSSPSQFSEHDKSTLTQIVEEATKKNTDNQQSLNTLLDLFLLKLPGSKSEALQIDLFFRRCMQFTGPLMAKGIEDTAFYSYNPFVGHNEVGDSPGYFGITTETFHRYMEERLEKQPLTMNALSTHDTKRGEDARARLNVLSDVPEKWMDATRTWRKINHRFKTFQHKKEVPAPNDEYLIYQVLCAHLPMRAKIDESFISRLEAYLVKALREAKVNSSWSDPDEGYENDTLKFVRNILSPPSEFPKSFLLFMEDLIPHGIVNSITQLILKNLAPGVPDTFQGTEDWNLSFVDPDNRRPVDYLELSETLVQLVQDYSENALALAAKLWGEPVNANLKKWISWLSLHERSRYEDLFLKGTYVPLNVIGKYRKNIIAFYRNFHDEHMIVVLPLNTASLPDGPDWEDTWIKLPDYAPVHWENRLTKNRIKISGNLPIADVFSVVPFGILRNSFD